MAVHNRFATLLKFIMAAVVAGLLLNAPIQAMAADCHTEGVAVGTVHAPPQFAPADGDHHQNSALKDKLCCAKTCAVCIGSIPSPASVALGYEPTPAYFTDRLVSLSGQDSPAVFEPPRSILL